MTAHEVLGVPPDATRDTIDRAWRELAMLHHPDRNIGDDGAAERLHAVNAAYAEVTGRHPPVDHVEQQAIMVLALTVSGVLGEMIGKGQEPKSRDLADAIRAKLKANLVKGRERHNGQEDGLKKLTALAGRFSGTSAGLLEDIVSASIVADARKQMDQTAQEIKAMERAVEMMTGTTFRADLPPGAYLSIDGHKSFVAWGTS